MRMSSISNTIVGTVRNLLKRRANSEPTVEASSLAAKNSSKVMKVMTKINPLTHPNEFYTQIK